MSGTVVIKGLKITDDQIRYIFPRNIQKISKFKFLLPMRTLLKEQFMQLGLPNFPYYQTKRHMKKQSQAFGRMRRRRFRDPNWKPVQRQQVQLIQIFCRYCSNTLTYAFNEKQRCFKLKNFSVEHIHGRDKNQHQVYKEHNNPKTYTWTDGDYQYIQGQIDDIVNRLEQPIGPTNDDQQNQQQPTNFAEMIQILKKRNYFIYYEPTNFIENLQLFPDLFMFISPSMKQTYLKYHYCVGFDYTFSLIRQQPNKESARQYLVGTISGLNQFRRLSIFALVVSIGQHVQSTMKVFTKFFQYMGDQPHCIVTDQSPGIIWGLRKLQQNGSFKGEALWDTFHTLKNYKMANPPLKQKMRLMIRQKCKYSFQKMYLQAITMARTQAELDSLHRFIYESQKYCMSQINPVLVGMGVSNSQNQFVNSLIKNIICHEKKYVQVIYELTAFIEERNNMNHVIRMPNINIEEGINRKDLKLLRLSLNIRYLSFFFTQYFRLININMIHYQEDKSVYYVQDRISTHRVLKNELYTSKQEDKFSREHKIIQYKYNCSCQFRQKTGIPCQHLLKIATKNRDNLLQEIHPKYVIRDPSDLIKCIKSANKSDYNVPINKRGTWSSGRMLETYYVDKNSLQAQNQRKSADPRLIQPIPKGYLPALQQRNKIRNIRTQFQQTRNKIRQNSLRTLSFHRFANAGDFPEPINTFEVRKSKKQKMNKNNRTNKFNDQYFDESRSQMDSERVKMQEDSYNEHSRLQSSSSMFQDGEDSQFMNMGQESGFSKFSEMDSHFSRNSMKKNKLPKMKQKQDVFGEDYDDEQFSYLQNKSIIPRGPIKNNKINAQIKFNHDEMNWDKNWGENDAFLEECNYIHIPDQSESQGIEQIYPKGYDKNDIGENSQVFDRNQISLRSEKNQKVLNSKKTPIKIEYKIDKSYLKGKKSSKKPEKVNKQPIVNSSESQSLQVSQDSEMEGFDSEISSRKVYHKQNYQQNLISDSQQQEFQNQSDEFYNRNSQQMIPGMHKMKNNQVHKKRNKR